MSEPVPSRSPWYLLERDQAILYALGLLLLLTGAYCYVAGQWAAPAGVRALEPGQGIDYRVDLNRADVAGFKKKMEEGGIQFSELTPEARAKFKVVASQVWSEFKDKFGTDLMDRIQKELGK